MLRYDPILPPDDPAPTQPFNLSATLRSLSAILTDDEVGAIHPLVEQKKRAPEELLRSDGVLYIRYFLSFWGVTGGTIDRHQGMFPNPASFTGVEKLTLPVEEQ